MSAGVEMVGVLAGFLLGPLLAAVSRVHMLVDVEIVMLVFVEVSLGHFYQLL